MSDLHTIAQAALESARVQENGRHAEVIVADGPLRQIVLALVQGAALAEHNAPPAASMQVLAGKVKITGVESSIVSAGELQPIPHQRHGVEALEDSVFLLTTVTHAPAATSPA